MGITARLQNKLFRWQQSDGNAPLTIGQRRIFILPSRAGLFYGLMLVVMLTAAINYNLALGHALVFLLASLGMTGMIHTFRNLHALVVVPGRCEAVFAGETAQFQITLVNEHDRLRAGLNFANGKAWLADTAVNAGETRKITLPIPATRRGWLELPRVTLSTTYPLGLFTAWAYLRPAMRCLVYPSPLNTALPTPLTMATQGEAQGDGGAEDFAGFRERQPTDALQHVAWKASARQDERSPLLIKQFSGGARQQLQLDWSQTDTGLDAETRYAILTGWVLAADAAGDRYSLHLPDRQIATGLGPAHRQRCLEALALAGQETA